MPKSFSDCNFAAYGSIYYKYKQCSNKIQLRGRYAYCAAHCRFLKVDISVIGVTCDRLSRALQCESNVFIPLRFSEIYFQRADIF